MAQYQLTQYGGDFSIGREFGTWGEARIGIRRMKGDAKIKLGDPLLPDYNFNQGEIFAKFFADTLTHVYFPKHGVSGSIEYLRSEEYMGADREFEQFGMEANLAKSWGKNTLIAGTKFYTTYDDKVSLENRYRLGGLFNLSGFNQDQLSGDKLGLIRLMYLRQINDFNLLPTYIRATLESGNVWEEKDTMDWGSSIFAGSLFFGVDTFLGPLYIGYGHAEGNNHAIYFYLGKKL